MRLLPLLLLLTGCFDGATTHVHLDLVTGRAHVVQQLHGASQDEMGCQDVDVPTCVDGIRKKVAERRAELEGAGDTVSRAGIVLVDGRLDVLYDYEGPANAMDERGLAFLTMQERTQKQWEAGKPGKASLAMVDMPMDGGTDTVTIKGKYKVIDGQIDKASMRIFLFSGKEADITSEWVPAPPTPPAEGTAPAPTESWVRAMPGLEDALKASGMVVGP
jgi:hypothetical protein